jgi:hypothetical protein
VRTPRHAKNNNCDSLGDGWFKAFISDFRDVSVELVIGFPFASFGFKLLSCFCNAFINGLFFIAFVLNLP